MDNRRLAVAGLPPRPKAWPPHTARSPRSHGPRQNLFVQQHDIPLGPGRVERGYFTPDDDIADLWEGAVAGTLSADRAAEFRNLAAHEYVENRLMEAGLPYRSAHPDTFDDDGDSIIHRDHPGAHDLAPNEWRPEAPLRHWTVFLKVSAGGRTIVRIVPYILHWAALDTRPDVDLPDPFEPLLRLFERDGGFHTENGEVNLEYKSVRMAGWRDRAGDPPMASFAAADLDEIDRAGSLAQFGHVIGPD